MPFIIEWVDCFGLPECRVQLTTPFAVLELSLCGDVICESDWRLDSGRAEAARYPLQQAIDRYWVDFDQPVVVKLKRQGSAFRNRVWAEMCRIPIGTTLSYRELANRIGSSARAVGNACRDNPYPLLIPCHRVVAAHGLGGYCGQTEGAYYDIKSGLLTFEAGGRS